MITHLTTGSPHTVTVSRPAAPINQEELQLERGLVQQQNLQVPQETLRSMPLHLVLQLKALLQRVRSVPQHQGLQPNNHRCLLRHMDILVLRDTLEPLRQPFPQLLKDLGHRHPMVELDNKRVTLASLLAGLVILSKHMDMDSVKFNKFALCVVVCLFVSTCVAFLNI